MKQLKHLLIVGTLFSASTIFAVPIDWTGSLGYDMHALQNIRKTKDTCAYSTTNGSQCIADDVDNARFQSYNLRLNPTLLVNDSVTIFGELSTGSIRGGYLGADSEWGSGANSSYYSVQTSGNNSLNVNQIYAKLYADTALFTVGKKSKGFGLGAILNAGEGKWDRYFTLYDGFEAEFKLGSFKLAPYWAKIYTDQTLPSGTKGAVETGVIAMYDDANTNFKAGAFYGIREVESNSDFFGGSATGKHETTIIDLFIEKKWDKARIAFEIPMIKGEVGSAYNNGTNQASLDATAYIMESGVKVGTNWELGLDAGIVAGDDGGTNGFEGVYLHPNYKISELMFSYNYNGFNNTSENIFDAAISNATYYKIYANYKGEAWDVDMAVIMATANKVAENGKTYYAHHQRKSLTAAADQSDELGMEFNFNLGYHWNPAVLISTYYAYHQVGDFYKFTNTATELSVDNVTAYGFRMSVDF